MLNPDSPQKKLAAQVAGLLHSDQYYLAAKAVRDWVAESNPAVAKSPVDTKAQATAFLFLLLKWLLDNNGQEEAAQLLWSETQFTAEPKATRDIWGTFDKEDFIMLMGSASMSKSFSVAVKLFLEWIRDPEFTTVRVLGPNEDHLEANLFSHLVSLFRSSTIPLPGEVGKLFIGLDPRSRKGSISGVVIPVGKKSSGRLQGVKRIPRKNPHPVFGPLSRLYIFLDEVSNIPVGVWRDVDNILSNVAGAGDKGLKIICAFNPTGVPGDDVGVRCEPPFGWQAFDLDKHYSWRSKRGWSVLRLDAAQCENVLAGVVIYPGLQSKAGYDAIIRNSGGTNSPGYYAMCRACYSPMGTVLSLIPQGLLNDIKCVPTWYEKPKPCAGVDLALEGKDSARFALGEFGLATSLTFPPSLAHPEGHVVIFKDEKGRNQPRHLLYLKQIFKLPSCETVAMTEEITRLCRATGVSPEWVCVDKTGNGAGVHDLLKFNYSQAINGVNYSAGPSKTRILAEDSGTCEELYDRLASELFFALRKYVEFGVLKFAPAVDTSDLYGQMTGRLYRATGKTARIESKIDYRSRNNGHSPDDADAVTLLIHAVRCASGIVPGMSLDNTEDLTDDDGDWYPSHRISHENKFFDLDSP